jgi:hypothetical protein
VDGRIVHTQTRAHIETLIEALGMRGYHDISEL